MTVRQIGGCVLAASVLLTAAIASSQDGPPSGKVTVQSKSVALGVGVSWGDGKLSYRGREYPFSVNGLSVVDLGVSRVTAAGDVFNLEKIEDFSGNYVAAAGGATVGAGAGAIVMKNQHGVVMRLTGTGQGVQFTLASKGVDVELKE